MSHLSTWLSSSSAGPFTLDPSHLLHLTTHLTSHNSYFLHLTSPISLHTFHTPTYCTSSTPAIIPHQPTSQSRLALMAPLRCTRGYITTPRHLFSSNVFDISITWPPLPHPAVCNQKCPSPARVAGDRSAPYGGIKTNSTTFPSFSSFKDECAREIELAA